MKSLIVYDSKYGNTKKVGELIAEGLKTIEGNEVIIENVKEIDLNKEQNYDLILIGSPNHYGSCTKPIKNLITKLPESSVKGNAYAVFETYMFNPKKVVKIMEKRINEVIPHTIKISPGLSIKVAANKGPIMDEELPKCKEFGIKLAK
ncbi:MAG: flavodoxin family protein [Promethearchaeota archaeon]